MYTLFFVFLGHPPRLWGGMARARRSAQSRRGRGGVLVRRHRDRRVGVVQHQLWMMWLGLAV
jgi:hypothetical protein